MKIFKLPIVALFLTTYALMQGCATPTFEACVTTFADWDSQNAEPMNYVFVHPDKQEISLEHKTYEQSTRLALEQAGFTEADCAQNAHYLIELKISSATGQCLESYPIFNDDPFALYIPGYYWGSSRYFPNWSYPFGFGPRYLGERVIAQSCLKARLSLTIRNSKQNSEQGLPRSVYETSAATSSQTLTLLEMVPLLTQAAMSDFPEGNGRERTVTIKLEKTGPEIQGPSLETRKNNENEKHFNGN